MANALKLTQLSISEIKLNEFGEFVLKSCSDNSLVIVGPNDLCILELMHCTSSLSNTFPFKQICAEIPKSQPLKNLMHPINLSNIYEKCNVQESQELGLEPIYVGEYAVEPPKARVMHAEFVPMPEQQELQQLQQRHTKLWTVLTSYGVCDLMYLTAITKEYHYMDTNLSTILINDIFPITKNSSKQITTFYSLRDHVNQYWITYFCWRKSTIKNGNIMKFLYLGTAAGYIIVLQYNSITQNFQKCSHEQVTKTRIVYMYNIDNFLLIVDGEGVIQLLQINHETANVTKCQYLWTRQDRITCHKAVITFVPETKSYLAIFFKSAHLFINHFNKDGIEISKNKLFINDIKITALELITATEFIITTITGNIKLIQIHIHSNTNELKLTEKTVQHEFDINHYQILGISSTKNRYLWSILLYRKKEYTHYSKFSNNSVFVSVCKLNNKDLIVELDRRKISRMEDIIDLIIVIILNISNDKLNDINQYNEYLDLRQLLTTTKTSVMLELNDNFLQKLQIKFILLQHQIKQQRFKYKICKRQTLIELEFLESVIQLIQILYRLKYLYKLNEDGGNHSLSSFQKLSIACMLNKWDLLMATLKSLKTDENLLNDCIATIVPILMHEQILNCPWDMTMLQFTKEECNICNETLDDFNMCKQKHAIKRCSISYVQLPLFHTRYCPQCFAIVVPTGNRFNLEELFPKNHSITCTFCRFSLIQDEL